MDQEKIGGPMSFDRSHPKRHNPFQVIQIVQLILCISLLPELIYGVVVDGDQKESISASRRQKWDEKENLDPFNTKSCGISDPNSDEHEFVSMAREGEFPWLVSFQIKMLSDANYTTQLKAAGEKESDQNQNDEAQKTDDLHFCCGSLISDRWILSAAHCFVGETIENYLKSNKLKVVAGSHKVSSRTSLNKNFTIERVYYHSKFNKSMPIGFDIALVELTEPVKFSSKRKQNEFGEQKEPFMNAICLPKHDKKYKFNESARIAGWGLSHDKDFYSMPSKLLTTDILLSKQHSCAKQYAKRLKSDEPKKRTDYICASYKKTRDSCQSDSGGPLMQYVNRKAVAIGIVSYGVACASKGVPGVYTKVSAYVNWIKDITENGSNAKVEFKKIESKETGESKENKTVQAKTKSPDNSKSTDQ